MKWSDRDLEMGLAVVTAVALSGVLFGHISTWWLFLPMILGGMLMSRR